MRNLSVEIRTGKIIDQPVDMIINSSNTYFLLGSGTAEQVRNAGGYLPKDDNEYRNLKQEIKMKNSFLGTVLDYIDNTERLPSKAQNMRLRHIVDNGSKELRLGDAATFPSGNLSNIPNRAKYISDSVGMTYDWKIQPKPPVIPATFDSVKDSLSKSFSAAIELDCRSVAVPVMCTRKGGLTKEESSNATLEAMDKLNVKDSKVNKVFIVLYSDELEKEKEWFQKFYKRC